MGFVALVLFSKIIISNFIVIYVQTISVYLKQTKNTVKVCHGFFFIFPQNMHTSLVFYTVHFVHHYKTSSYFFSFFYYLDVDNL